MRGFFWGDGLWGGDCRQVVLYYIFANCSNNSVFSHWCCHGARGGPIFWLGSVVASAQNSWEIREGSGIGCERGRYSMIEGWEYVNRSEEPCDDAHFCSLGTFYPKMSMCHLYSGGTLNTPLYYSALVDAGLRVLHPTPPPPVIRPDRSRWNCQHSCPIFWNL